MYSIVKRESEILSFKCAGTFKTWYKPFSRTFDTRRNTKKALSLAEFKRLVEREILDSKSQIN